MPTIQSDRADAVRLLDKTASYLRRGFHPHFSLDVEGHMREGSCPDLVCWCWDDAFERSAHELRVGGDAALLALYAVGFQPVGTKAEVLARVEKAKGMLRNGWEPW